MGSITKLNDNIFVYHSDHSHLHETKPHPLTDGKHPPYTLQNQTRYIGEDASFTCNHEIVVFDALDPLIDQVIWVKDGNLLTPDDRHLISWTFKSMKQEKIQDKVIHWFMLTSTLKILMLDHNDFGKYYCHVFEQTHLNVTKISESDQTEALYEDSVYDFSRTNNGFKIRTEQIEIQWTIVNHFVWNSEFHLKMDLPRRETVFAEPGAYFSYVAYYRHLGNTEDISMRYTINDKEPDFNDSKCSKFVIFYYGFYRNNIVQSFINVFAYLPKVEEMKYELGLWNGSNSVLQHCVSPDSYGIHRFVISRKVFKEQNNTYDVKEFKHPIKLDIRPKESDLFNSLGHGMNSSGNIDVDCWNTEENIHSANCASHYQHVERITRDFSREENFYLAIIGVYLYILYRVASILFNDIEVMIDVNFKYDKMCDYIRKYYNEIKYHVFISCSENEEERAKVITSYLEDKGRKVFLPKRDIPLGLPELLEIGTAISQSIAIIIIISYENFQYIALKHYEICMILQRVKKNNLLVVRADECPVPGILSGHTIIDTINHTVDERDKILRKWYDKNFVSPESLIPVGLIAFRCIMFILVILISMYYLIKEIRTPTLFPPTPVYEII
ncbi:hypothetical protein SNE40_008842 [Patella caerulea]|uniref:TIR domain-containing protein n=1 Tax=Patella caerulea TaxID=87958 RepID=A0AAN8PWU4_PATCE